LLLGAVVMQEKCAIENNKMAVIPKTFTGFGVMAISSKLGM
jgi:hypothetical protein